MKNKSTHNSQTVAVASKKKLPETTKPDPFKDDMPGWIWVLTIQDMPDELKEVTVIDEETYSDLDIDGDIVGCFATKALMVAEMKKLGKYRYGMFHLKVEGWTEQK